MKSKSIRPSWSKPKLKTHSAGKELMGLHRVADEIRHAIDDRVFAGDFEVADATPPKEDLQRVFSLRRLAALRTPGKNINLCKNIPKDLLDETLQNKGKLKDLRTIV